MYICLVLNPIIVAYGTVMMRQMRKLDENVVSCYSNALAIPVMIGLVYATGGDMSAWKEFEVRHGNEDTLREMLRIKRSVQHQYNTQVNMMSAQMLSGELAQDTPVLEASGAEPALPDSMKELDKENVSKNFVSFVRGEAQSKAVLEAEKEDLG